MRQVDHVPDTADLPSYRIGGPDLSPHRIEVRPNPIPTGKRNGFGSMAIAARTTRSSRPWVPTGALGLRAESAGTFFRYLRTGQRSFPSLMRHPAKTVVARSDVRSRAGIHSSDHSSGDCVQAFHALNHAPAGGRGRVFAS